MQAKVVKNLKISHLFRFRIVIFANDHAIRFWSGWYRLLGDFVSTSCSMLLSRRLRRRRCWSRGGCLLIHILSSVPATFPIIAFGFLIRFARFHFHFGDLSGRLGHFQTLLGQDSGKECVFLDLVYGNLAKIAYLAPTSLGVQGGGRFKVS